MVDDRQMLKTNLLLKDVDYFSQMPSKHIAFWNIGDSIHIFVLIS